MTSLSRPASDTPDPPDKWVNLSGMSGMSERDSFQAGPRFSPGHLFRTIAFLLSFRTLGHAGHTPLRVCPDVRSHDDWLIAGCRRLEACKLFGWREVPIRHVALDEIVRGTFAENAERNDFLPARSTPSGAPWIGAHSRLCPISMMILDRPTAKGRRR
jgi:hypothetical protein